MKINYALFSGFCASAASLFGKLCSSSISQDIIIVKGLFFLLMLLSNALVWTFFVKALQEVESSLTATVISAAANYVFSALTGYFVFGEVTTLIWWSGMFFILLGLLLIIKDGPNEVIMSNIKKEK